MQFTKSASLLVLFFLGLVGLVAASPVTAAKRDVVQTEAYTAMQTLHASIASPLASLAAIKKSSSATQANVAPHIADITTALKTAQATLSEIKASGISKRQDLGTELGTLVAQIIRELAETLDGLFGPGLLGEIFPGLDADLNAVLAGLEVLLAGVLNLVATLLTDVAGLLTNIGLGLTLGSLGL